MIQKHFLLTTKGASVRLTELFDFVWPTAAAIWNLRWEVAGFLEAVPTATTAALKAKFTTGSGIDSVNLRKSCIDVSWEDQQQEFARFLLFEICGLYEAWCEGALSECLYVANPHEEPAKRLQFPTVYQGGTPVKGVGAVLARTGASPSQLMQVVVYPALTTHAKYSLPTLENLLVCYRYFKELRNSLIHAGGTIPQRLLNAESDYGVETAASLGLNEVPAWLPSVAGVAPRVSLRGVVGLGEVVLRLITTLDAEFARSALAEPLFRTRWIEAHGAAAVALSTTDQHRRIDRSRAHVYNLGLPRPSYDPSLPEALKTAGLVTF